MAAPSGDVDVCNLALDIVGNTDSISSINPPSSSIEALLSRQYDHNRRAVLRDYPWHFATKTIYITRIGTPLIDYSDQYQLPTDYIRLLSVAGQTVRWQVPTDAFMIIGKTICINSTLANSTGIVGAGTIPIRYIYDCTDITQWVDDAIAILAHRLALNICNQITKQDADIARISKSLESLKPSAFAVDGQENTPKRIEYSKAINKRRYQLDSNLVASPYTIIP